MPGKACQARLRPLGGEIGPSRRIDTAGYLERIAELIESPAKLSK
jgi:hypothetical protein